MESQEYIVGRVQALAVLGLFKEANIPADQTTVGRMSAALKGSIPEGKGADLLNKAKKVIPTTPLGRTVALGGLLGAGMGINHIRKGKEQGTQMEAPLYTSNRY